MSITLFCLVQGTPAFPVDIDRNLTVGHLKDAVKAKNTPEFDSWPANKLRLWKVEIPDDQTDLIQGQTLQDNDQLPPTHYLDEYWADTPKRRHIHVIIKLPLLTLEKALSYVTPLIYYAPNASSSTSSTNAGGDPPTKVALWKSFFDDVNGFTFDSIDPKPKFEKPQFTDYANVRYEEGVRTAFQTNICEVLNKLMGPDYEFSRWKDGSPGIPDFNCHYTRQLILCIENKRGLVLREISGRTFSDFYESSSKAKMVIQQIYNYMCTRQLQYGVLSTYEDHWFLRRPHETPSKLFVSSTLSSQSESPTVLKAYAYIVMQARDSPPSPHPNIITVPVSEGSDNTTQNKRITRSMVPKGQDSTQGSSSTTSANQPNQLNLSYADFRFKGILGEGRSGKTLLCEFRGDEIALKIADLYKTAPDILKEMQKEVQIYIEDLKDIQGKYIPKLACYGYYGGGWCYAIGTTIVGTHISHDNKIPKQQKPRALKALYEIHNRGVLHNDIREENILLDSVGRVYLIDFGMARRLDPKKKRKLFDEEKREFSRLLDYYTVWEFNLYDVSPTFEKI